MPFPRLIPVLLLKDEGLYKGVRFRNHVYVGDPINTVKIFNDKEVDELVILDTSASITGREPNFALIEKITSEAFMPLAYGGGVKSIEHARKLFSLGLEKIVLCSSPLEDVRIITDIARIYGSQSVVVCVEYQRGFFGGYKVTSKAGRKRHKIPLETYIGMIHDAGAGEIMLNSIDHDGTLEGYDISTIQRISRMTSLPIIASGGAGCLNDFTLAQKAGASAVAAGSIFVFQGPHRAVLITYPAYQEVINLFEEKNAQE